MAILLFARCPDARDGDQTPQELYDHRVPGAVKFFALHVEHGRFEDESHRVRLRELDWDRPRRL